MSNLLYIVALILLVGWILGYFVFSAGALIHLLIVVAIVLVVIRLVTGRRL